MDADKYAKVEVQSEAALWAWLDENHRSTQTVWLVTWKAVHADKYLSREAVLDALIAYGWVDGRRMVLDADRTMQLISPRQQQAWAKSYKDRVVKLLHEGRMQPSGEDAVTRGKESGLWHFFDDVDALIVPSDLAGDLDLARWDALAPSYRRNVLRWIKLAKTDKTRAKRINEVVQTTKAGTKIPQM